MLALFFSSRQHTQYQHQNHKHKKRERELEIERIDINTRNGKKRGSGLKKDAKKSKNLEIHFATRLSRHRREKTCDRNALGFYTSHALFPGSSPPVGLRPSDASQLEVREIEIDKREERKEARDGKI